MLVGPEEVRCVLAGSTAVRENELVLCPWVVAEWNLSTLEDPKTQQLASRQPTWTQFFIIWLFFKKKISFESLFDTMFLGVEVTRLDAIDHGVELPGRAQRGVSRGREVDAVDHGVEPSNTNP